MMQSEDKLCVVVLFGGMSSEHEVSRVSAGTFVDQLDRQRYELLTIGITLTMLKRGKDPAEQPGDSSIITPAPAPEGEEDISDHYQINETSSALLTGTADAGDAYQEQTLFIGDSNTVRLYANGLISLQQFCAKEGIGTSAALNEGIVTFKRDDNRYTIAQAVAKMKPRRVVIMLGTNDNGMNTEDFISNYTALVQAIQASYPYTDIIVNTVPPVPSNHSNYPNICLLYTSPSPRDRG